MMKNSIFMSFLLCFSVFFACSNPKNGGYTEKEYEVKLQQVYKKIGSEKAEAEGTELWEMLQHCNKSSGDKEICKRGTHRLDYLNCQHTRVAPDDREGITDLTEIWNMLKTQRLEVLSRWK